MTLTFFLHPPEPFPNGKDIIRTNVPNRFIKGFRAPTDISMIIDIQQKSACLTVAYSTFRNGLIQVLYVRGKSDKFRVFPLQPKQVLTDLLLGHAPLLASPIP